MNDETIARAQADLDQGESDHEFDRTVLDMALTGRDMAALALTGSSHMALEDYETGLADALCNLMHFARRYDIDFDAELARATRHHEVESQYGWDEVPDA